MVSLVAKRSMRYGTRHLEAGETFEARAGHARVLTALSRAEEAPAKPVRQYQTREMTAARPEPVKAPEADDEVVKLRAAYVKKFGKRPFMGWDAETLTARLAED